MSEINSINTLSLLDALPIFVHISGLERRLLAVRSYLRAGPQLPEKWSWTAQQIEAFEISPDYQRSEEHTSELQSREKLVCRLLLEKKKYMKIRILNINVTNT